MANFELSIIITVLVLLFYYFYLAKNLNFDVVPVESKLKFVLMEGAKAVVYLTLIWMLLIPTQLAIEINEFNTGPADITNIINWFYQVQIWFNYFLTFSMVIWFLLHMLGKMEDSVK